MDNIKFGIVRFFSYYACMQNDYKCYKTKLF